VTVTRAALAAAGDDQQKAAPLGLFVLLLMGVACYFLFKSMSRHLKRVREDFPAGSRGVTTSRSTTAAAPTAAAGAPAAMRSTPAGRASDDGPGLVKQEPDGAGAAADGEH
jgi:hypothetical protein